MSEKHALHLPTNPISALLCMLAGGMIFGAVSSSFADGDDATQSVLGADLIVPYDGYMMIDSAPITGTRTIKFELYTSQSGGAAVWTEEQTVQLYNGRFSVGLGTSTSLTQTILDAEKIWLAMTIVGTDAQGVRTEIALSGRQAIEPAPFAAWAANSADLKVAGALQVDGDAQVDGNMDLDGILRAHGNTVLGSSTSNTHTANGSLDVTDSFTVGSGAIISGADNNGAVSALRIDRGNGANYMLLDDEEIDSTLTLKLQGNTGNGTSVGGTLSVTGNTRLDAALTTLGASTLGDDASDTHTLLGADNDGASSAVQIGRGDGAGGYILLDDNEIDTTVANLVLNGNSGRAVEVGGDLTVDGDITNFTTEGPYYAYNVNNDGANSRTSGCRNSSGTSASCSNSSSGGSINLGSTTNRICFLSLTEFNDMNNGGKNAYCHVYTSGSSWLLRAAADNTQTDVRCNARCLSW